MSLLEALPRTGRTHQIRVHTQSLHHPIACDDKYGDFLIVRRTPPQAEPDFLDFLSRCILFQNKQIMVVNKPHGLPVHGGTSIHLGVIEACRQLPGCEHYLELVHRLDKNTSGCLVLAKKASALKKIQRAFAHRTIKKSPYLSSHAIGWCSDCV